jgi:DNA recombination protein RmuC
MDNFNLIQKAAKTICRTFVNSIRNKQKSQMDIIYIVIGIVLGAGALFLVFNTRLKFALKEQQRLENENREAAQEIERLTNEIRQKEEQLNEETRRYLELEADIKVLESKLAARDEDLEKQEKTFKENLKEQEEKYREIQEQLKAEFKNLATDILEEKSKKFSETSQKDIGELLKPLQNKIDEFKKQVNEVYDKEGRERFSLIREIKQLAELNTKLTTGAENLTKALKGDSKMQGDWGEMILENILEQSGLTKGREYLVQETYDNAEGRKSRPDVIVRYPGNRCVIIDSKVSLTNYEQYVNAQTEEERKQAIKLHLNSVSKHIKELSAKNYQDLLDDCKSPDFVMMFMPLEPAYLLAVQNKQDLWIDAYKKKVLLISPTNLIAALRMISELWHQDKQNKNVARIAEESGKLYDKFVGFLEDMDKLEKQIGKLGETYTDARKKLEKGSGNLIGKAELIKKLGAKQKKNIPASFLNAYDAENEIETANNDE